MEKSQHLLCQMVSLYVSSSLRLLPHPSFFIVPAPAMRWVWLSEALGHSLACCLWED